LGPLAGVLAGLDWAAQQVPRVSHVATFATDTPFFPKCLVPKLAAAVRCGAELACARCQGRLQPLFAMWPVALRADLRRALAHDGARRVDRWMAERRLAEVEFASEGHDPFFNLNEPSDLAAAEALLRRNS